MTIDEAINILRWLNPPRVNKNSFDNFVEARKMAIDALEEQRWIPVSESMPEEHEWIGTKMFGTTISDEVYVTFEAPDGQRFTDHISFQNGKLSRSDEHKMKVIYKGAKPIAWKSFPEPY